MNAQRTFTTSSRRALVALLVAATLTLTAIFGQAALSSLTGLALANTAYACQTNVGGC